MDQLANTRDEAAGAGNAEMALAKINLALHVGAERGDGYHDLESLVVFADVADALIARPAKDVATTTLDMSGPFADVLQETTASAANLVLRAAQAIAARGCAIGRAGASQPRQVDSRRRRTRWRLG